MSTKEDKKEITIEVLKDRDDWLDFPPRLSVKEEGDKEPTFCRGYLLLWLLRAY